MERLTKRLPGGAADYNYPKSCYFGDGSGADRIAQSAFRQRCIEQLADYEDMGLTPEEIEKLRAQNEQLRESAALVTKESAELLERRWIPVEERLPEVWRNDETAELVNYMIYSPDFGVDIGNYHAKAKKWLCMALPCTVTHWMPLPSGPEVE